jgi:hypothetical protein
MKTKITILMLTMVMAISAHAQCDSLQQVLDQKIAEFTAFQSKIDSMTIVKDSLEKEHSIIGDVWIYWRDQKDSVVRENTFILNWEILETTDSKYYLQNQTQVTSSQDHIKIQAAQAIKSINFIDTNGRSIFQSSHNINTNDISCTIPARHWIYIMHISFQDGSKIIKKIIH